MSLGSTECGDGVNLITGDIFPVPGGIETNLLTLGSGVKEIVKNLKYNHDGWHPYHLNIVIDYATRTNIQHISNFLLWKIHKSLDMDVNQVTYISNSHWSYNLSELEINVKFNCILFHFISFYFISFHFRLLIHRNIM